MTRLANLGVSELHDEGGIVFEREVRTLDVFVHLANAAHCRQMRAINGCAHRTWEPASRVKKATRCPLDHDLAIVHPNAGVDVEHAAQLDKAVDLSLSRRDKDEILADADFVSGVDQRVVGQGVDHFRYSFDMSGHFSLIHLTRKWEAKPALI